MSMSSQWAKWLVISAWLSRSASATCSRVASEKTTPKPKVSSGRFRSTTVMSWVGSDFFLSRLEQSSAGPPPIDTILIASILRPGGALPERLRPFELATRARSLVHEQEYGGLGATQPVRVAPLGEPAPRGGLRGVPRGAGAPPRPPLLRARARQGRVPVRRQR